MEHELVMTTRGYRCKVCDAKPDLTKSTTTQCPGKPVQRNRPECLICKGKPIPCDRCN